ncbi:MAG: FtsX-like permease family protein [Candidatus Aminicenantes bacterium]|nr:FtsX-like permease family protein [Candidatus Aminicenantes bacterium]
MAISFFLNHNIKSEEIDTLKQEVLSSGLNLEIKLVSSEEALQRFKNNFPELQDIISSLNTNPFPPALEVRFKEKALSIQTITAFMERIKKIPGVEDVQFNREWVEKMASLSRIVRAIGLFLGSILILASFFIISNVIRLNVFARKNEIEILRLVGATNNFIRLPFLIEGFVLGVLGSLLSLVILFLLMELFPLYVGNSLGAARQLFELRPLTSGQISWLIAGGIITGTLGSVTSISRFLKV